MRWVVVAVAVGSMRCSRYEAMAGGGGRERLNSEAITEAIRPCTPQGAFGARHGHTRLERPATARAVEDRNQEFKPAFPI